MTTQLPVPRRSPLEWLFLLLFFPGVLGFYTIYKYPHWILPAGTDLKVLHLFGKSPGFWYATVYTGLVCGVAGWVLLADRNLYARSRKQGRLSTYQRGKFLSIFWVQLIAFYLFPFVLPGLTQEGGFFHDPGRIAGKAAHVYVYPAFQSVGLAIYMFLVIPVAVWFFGKRYCSWFCSCGNLAEAVGVLPWGAKWVRWYTPRGPLAQRLEALQTVVLVFACLFGVLLLLDGLHVVIAPTAVQRLQAVQDFLIDFLFGSVIGVGAYPLLGTRIWCRYGCPMAKGMQLFGWYTRSRFAVVPNDKCRGLNLCTQACPMGIDVAAYAHKDKRPIEVAFGLETVCVGCGGCIEVCPVGALSFAPLSSGRWGIATKQVVELQDLGESPNSSSSLNTPASPSDQQ